MRQAAERDVKRDSTWVGSMAKMMTIPTGDEALYDNTADQTTAHSAGIRSSVDLFRG